VPSLLPMGADGTQLVDAETDKKRYVLVITFENNEACRGWNAICRALAEGGI
jgi:hypothetical protein